MNETTETDTDTMEPMAPVAPYDADMHCRKIAWMVKHSADWDYETQTLEQYLDTVPEYPTDAQVKDFDHMWVEPFVPFKKEIPFEGDTAATQ